VHKLAGKETPWKQDLPMCFAGPLIQDLSGARKGQFHPFTSRTLERAGEFGMEKLPKLVEALKAAGKLPANYNLSPILAGVPDIVGGAASQIGRGKPMPTIDELTRYLDGINKSCWAVAGRMAALSLGAPPPAAAFVGSVTADAANLAADIGRGMTYPIFKAAANNSVRNQMIKDFRIQVEAATGHRQSAKTLTEMFTPKLLKDAGFNQKTVAELDNYAKWANATAGGRNLSMPITPPTSTQKTYLDRKMWPFPPDKFGGGAAVATTPPMRVPPPITGVPSHHDNWRFTTPSISATPPMKMPPSGGTPSYHDTFRDTFRDRTPSMKMSPPVTTTPSFRDNFRDNFRDTTPSIKMPPPITTTPSHRDTFRDTTPNISPMPSTPSIRSFPSPAPSFPITPTFPAGT